MCTGTVHAASVLTDPLCRIPFVLLLWLHAVFVSIGGAAFYGWVWLAFRALYVVVYPMGMPWLFASTLPNYFCLLLLAYPLVHLSA